MSSLTIRSMTPAELDLAVEWAAAEGWNPGLEDAAAFRAADPDGFRMAFLDDEPAACISVVRYGEAFAFLGFYICRPPLRGRGIGYALWQDSLDWLGERGIGLDGVVDQQANYRKAGFVLAHRNVRYASDLLPLVEPGERDPALLPIDAELAERIAAYDSAHCGWARPRFLEAWLAPAETRHGTALVEDGELRGYGVLRQAREGMKVGPLFAADARTAERLLSDFTIRAGNHRLFLDVPEPNAAGVALARDFGLEPVFETARMYRGPAPDLPLEEVFGITSFELG